MSKNDNTDDGAPGEGERIAKVLSRAGVASRRDAERLVLEGRVRVNGEVVNSPPTPATARHRLAAARAAAGGWSWGGGARESGEAVPPPATNVTARDRLAVDGETVGAPEATRLWIF